MLVSQHLRTVSLGYDKVFIARSRLCKHHSCPLRELADEQGMDGKVLVDGLMQKAIDEGPASVAALNELLSFKTSWFPLNDETRHSTQTDRHMARLSLLSEVADGLDKVFGTLSSSVSLDISRVRDKVELAQRRVKSNNLFQNR